jgi:membrane associated rhomboid family serine protease
MARSRHAGFLAALQTSFLLVGVMFFVKAVELAADVSFAGFGIVPRDQRGLIGLLFSPLLHGDAAHLLANSVPLLVLLTLLFWDRKYHPWITLAFIWLASGLGTWLIGRGMTNGQLTVHIGASSVIY